MTSRNVMMPASAPHAARQRARYHLFTGLRLLAWAAGLALVAALGAALNAGLHAVSVKLALAIILDAVVAAGALALGLMHVAVGAVRLALARRAGR
ncbi:MAG: hypothetical protein U0531_06375 [Dehalococcoidia bacterium]